MDTVVPQSFNIGDTSWKKASLTILYIQSTSSLGKLKSTTFSLCQYTIYSSVLKNFDLQIYNFFYKNEFKFYRPKWHKSKIFIIGNS